MIAARSVSVIVAGHDLGRRLGRRRDAGQPIEGADEARRVERRRVGGRAPASAGRVGRAGLAPEQPDPARGRPRPAAGRRRGGPGRGAAGRAARPRGRCLRRRARAGSIGPAARQHRPALDQDQLAGDRHERADVAEPVGLERRERIEVGVGERAERDGQDVELARLDERQQERRAGRRTRPPGPGWRVSGRRPSPNRIAGRPSSAMPTGIRPRPSVRLVGEPQQLAELGVARRVLVADQLDGPWRAAGAAASRGRVSAWVRSRSRAARNPGSTPADAPDPRAVAPARASRRPAARRRSRPCRRRGAARRAGASGSVTPSARSEATTSRPWRRSATCIESKSASCAGSIQVASAARSSGATRARRCARNWRTLDAHQEAVDRHR